MTEKPTPRTDSEDRWQVDRDDLGRPTRDTVRIEFARELERENAALRVALVELVACKDLNLRALAISPTEPGCEREVLMDIWRQREPKAWTAASALVEE